MEPKSYQEGGVSLSQSKSYARPVFIAIDCLAIFWMRNSWVGLDKFDKMRYGGSV